MVRPGLGNRFATEAAKRSRLVLLCATKILERCSMPGRSPARGRSPASGAAPPKSSLRTAPPTPGRSPAIFPTASPPPNGLNIFPHRANRPGLPRLFPPRGGRHAKCTRKYPRKIGRIRKAASVGYFSDRQSAFLQQLLRSLQAQLPQPLQRRPEVLPIRWTEKRLL